MGGGCGVGGALVGAGGVGIDEIADADSTTLTGDAAGGAAVAGARLVAGKGEGTLVGDDVC